MDDSALLIAGVGGLGCSWATRAHNNCINYADLVLIDAEKNSLLEGRTIFNLFFEDSTRTRTSFEVAAKRLGADLINVVVKDSSINKGDTVLDTMTTFN